MFGVTEVLVIAGVVVLLFGAKKLPELGKATREMVDNFKAGKEGEEEKSDTEEVTDTETVKN